MEVIISPPKFFSRSAGRLRILTTCGSGDYHNKNRPSSFQLSRSDHRENPVLWLHSSTERLLIGSKCLNRTHERFRLAVRLQTNALEAGKYLRYLTFWACSGFYLIVDLLEASKVVRPYKTSKKHKWHRKSCQECIRSSR